MSNLTKYRPRSLALALSAIVGTFLVAASPAAAQTASPLTAVKDQMSSQIGDVSEVAIYGVALVLGVVVIGVLVNLAARWIKRAGAKA